MDSCTAHQISGDGRFVTFVSNGTGLVPNDSNSDPTFGNQGNDVFVHDLNTRRTERISVSATGGEGRHSTDPMISPDGRYVSFASFAYARLVEDDRSSLNHWLEGGGHDSYVHDRATGSLVRVSEPLHGPRDKGWGGCGGALSRGGRHSVFISASDTLIEGDTNGEFDYFVRDLGTELGVGGFKGGKPPNEPPDDRICITPDLCVPPGAAVSSSDSVQDINDVLTERGANLYGASLAYRPQYEDLFVKIELEHMPKVIPGTSPIFYGLRFKSGDKSYEVRATSFNFGTFGLFDCTSLRPACTKVADLRGGYGTTGMRVVFSLPLDRIGLEGGGELKDVTAFSGIGTSHTGAAKVLDWVRLK